ncbi:MAG: Dephospho-CoA kinase [uncultured Cytophagales bacterium]|uniref:Dephospho-CoA kinase n=1 Tax=uncultured Cytophagales bacterium TaxID=158755 RepID=A0A6J4JZR8_9SPHI|nr:MAG: Dephospho-CoA kinase [uncultured Cytophagales bacterium]
MSKGLPRQIGITGGIGAGKSTVTRIFAALCVPVYDADSRARWLMNSDPALKAALSEAFGPQTYTAEGLNRTYLAATVFGDAGKTAQLNRLVHPRVGDDYAAWVREHAGFPYVLKEAALLFESGSYQTLDGVIAVSAPLPLRIRRVLQRDPHRTEADVAAIVARQMDEAEKMSRADYVVHNDEKTLLIPRVLDLDRTFRA